MPRRVVLVNAAVALLGLAATVLGSVASKKSKDFVRFEDLHGQQHCVYQRNPALGCGVAAALLALTGVTLATLASEDGCFRAEMEHLAPAASADGHETASRLAVAHKVMEGAWLLVLIATVLFLCGATMKRGTSPSPDWDLHEHRLRYYDKSDLFTAASVLSAWATLCAIFAYVSFQLTDEDEPAPGQVVAMGQPQWAHPYPPPPNLPPMASPPEYGHGGYGSRQPAGTA